MAKDPLIRELDEIRDRITQGPNHPMSDEFLKLVDVVKAIVVLQVLGR